MRGSNLEEVLRDDIESLCMVTDVLEVGILIQHRVVGIQEKVKRVLIQEVHLERDTNKISFLKGRIQVLGSIS